MNKQCESCIHSDVCAYKEHYEDAVELYEKAKKECGKYPWFICDIKCIKYSNVEKEDNCGADIKTDRKSCKYRHENGNCLKIGGFCTSIDDEHCVKGKVKLIIDVPRELAKKQWYTDKEVQTLISAIWNGISIPDNATNGDVMKIIFPKIGLHDEWHDEPYQKGDEDKNE